MMLAIFDCDGVLVDSEPLVNATHVEMMRARGFAIDDVRSLHEFAGVAMDVRLAAFARAYDWKPDVDYVSEFHARFEARMHAELRAVDGVRELLDGLTIPTCVVSNGTLSEIRTRLRVVGLDGRFGDRLTSAVDRGTPKPAPDAYLIAATSMGVRPSDCIVIEDSVTGVTAAIRAEMMVFGYAATSDPNALRAAGALPFTSMSEIASAIGLRCAARS